MTTRLHGVVTLLRALVESFNLATVRRRHRMSVSGNVAELIHRARRTGASRRPICPLLLGAVELAPIDVTQIYNTLANGGFRSLAPGRTVRSSMRTVSPCRRYPLEIGKAVDPAAVYQLNQGLVEVMRRGTGSTLRKTMASRREMITAGKTGTSDEISRQLVRRLYRRPRHGSLGRLRRQSPDRVDRGVTGALSIWAPMMSKLHGLIV